MTVEDVVLDHEHEVECDREKRDATVEPAQSLSMRERTADSLPGFEVSETQSSARWASTSICPLSFHVSRAQC